MKMRAAIMGIVRTGQIEKEKKNMRKVWSTAMAMAIAAGISGTAMAAEGSFTDIPKDHPLYVKGMISHVYRRMHRDEPSKTIIAAGGGGTWGYHFPEPRAFTNRERARLQSFPDDFEFIGSTTEVRRQIGNAVPSQGVVELAKAILPIFSDNYKKVDLHEKLKEEKAKVFQDRLNNIRGGKR